MVGLCLFPLVALPLKNSEDGRSNCKFYACNSLLTVFDAFYTGHRLIQVNLYLDRLTGLYHDK